MKQKVESRLLGILLILIEALICISCNLRKFFSFISSWTFHSWQQEKALLLIRSNKTGKIVYVSKSWLCRWKKWCRPKTKNYADKQISFFSNTALVRWSETIYDSFRMQYTTTSLWPRKTWKKNQFVFRYIFSAWATCIFSLR
jgi:hypothetical protein